MIQVCSNFHRARVFIINTCPDEIDLFAALPPGPQVVLPRGALLAHSIQFSIGLLTLIISLLSMLYTYV